MFTVAIFFLVLSILVLIHEIGHFSVAKLNGIKVEEFGFGLPPRLFGKRFGETLYSVNALPFGGFVKLLGEEEAELTGKKLSPSELERSFTHKKPWQKMVVLTAGVFFNFLLGWIIVSYLFTQGVPVPSDIVVIEEVAKGSPAEQVGLRVGDDIQKITAGTKKYIVNDSVDVSNTSGKYLGEEIMVQVERGDQLLMFPITPRKNPPKGQGSLGILISDYTIKKYSALEAPIYGLVESAKITAMIVKELGSMLARFALMQKPEADIAGPIGIAKLSSEAAREGPSALLQLIGILSLNLAVINILPFPALDGGRLMFVAYELVSRKKINPNIERRLNFAGFAILIGLIILVTINDIIKLFI